MTNNKPFLLISLLPRVFWYSNSQLTNKLSWLLYNGTQRQLQGYFSKHSMTNGNWIHKLFKLSKNKRKLEIKAILKTLFICMPIMCSKPRLVLRLMCTNLHEWLHIPQKWGSRNISWTWEIIRYCRPLKRKQICKWWSQFSKTIVPFLFFLLIFIEL